MATRCLLLQVSAHEGRGPGRIEDSCDGKGGMFKGVVEVPHCRRARAAVEAIADVDGLEGAPPDRACVLLFGHLPD